MTGTFFVIFFMIMGVALAATLALVQNAQDEDRSWEEAYKKVKDKEAEK